MSHTEEIIKHIATVLGDEAELPEIVRVTVEWCKEHLAPAPAVAAASSSKKKASTYHLLRKLASSLKPIGSVVIKENNENYSDSVKVAIASMSSELKAAIFTTHDDVEAAFAAIKPAHLPPFSTNSIVWQSMTKEQRNQADAIAKSA